MNLRTDITNNREFSTIDIELLSSLFDCAPDVAFFVKDREGRYLTVNDSLAIRHGRKKKSDVIGMHSSDLCIGDFGQLPSEQDELILKTGRPLIDHLELQWIRPHVPVWCLTTKLPVLDATGDIVGIVGFSRDLRAPLGVDEIPVDLAKALEEFEETLSEAVTSTWLAKHSKLSPQKLARLTKKLFGLTPTQLITKIRIANACQILESTDLAIADTAFRCGFYDHSAFTRSFRAVTGATPSEYRLSKTEKKRKSNS